MRQRRQLLARPTHPRLPPSPPKLVPAPHTPCTPRRNVVHGEFALTTLDGFFTPSYQALSGRMGVFKIDVEGFEDR